MAKRSHEDVVPADDSKEARREAKRLKKAKKAQVAGVAVDGTGAVVENGDSVTQSKKHKDKSELSKEERKALKRAKMEREKVKDKAKFKAHATYDAVDSASDASGDGDTVTQAEGKASKDAGKAVQKLKKGSTKGGAHGVTVSGSTDVEDGETVGYHEHAALAALPQTDIDAYVADKELAIEDPQKQLHRPILNFKYLPGDESQQVPFASFSAPTPIQAACWPYLFAGRDVIGVAETGSGKTLAFGVPCVRYIVGASKKDRKGIKACIVSPTRELALQIHEQLVKLAEPAGLKATCVYGGTSKDEQRATLRGTHIVVATPGRLNDFVQEGSIDLSKVGYLVLDEADRMLDKGFEQEVRKIISATLPTGRQTLMFTATWPPSVRELADTFMTKPVKVTIGDNASGELRANTRIVQEVEVLTQFDKQPRLIELLKQYQSGKNKHDRILVFCLYKKEATRIEEFIRRRGFNAGGIHGDLSQQKRMESLDAFKNGKVPILVATDVAARGLDIPAVKLVINVTFPLTVEDYVHRIGRTGRAGQDGRAVTFFTDVEKGLAGGLINVLKAANQPVPEELMKFGTTVKKKGHDAYGAFYKDTGDMKKATKITFD